MNRILFLLAIVTILLATGCRKKYNCYCSTYIDDNPVARNQWEVTGKWYNAKARCDEKGLEQAQQFSKQHSTSCVITQGSFVE